MRNEIAGGYDHPDVHTPHLDALVDSALTFERAYCQYVRRTRRTIVVRSIARSLRSLRDGLLLAWPLLQPLACVRRDSFVAGTRCAARRAIHL